MTEILTNLYLFKKSPVFGNADCYEIQVKAEKDGRVCDYKFLSEPDNLTDSVIQKLGICQVEMGCKILSVAVQPIFNPWLLKAF